MSIGNLPHLPASGRRADPGNPASPGAGGSGVCVCESYSGRLRPGANGTAAHFERQRTCAAALRSHPGAIRTVNMNGNLTRNLIVIGIVLISLGAITAAAIVPSEQSVLVPLATFGLGGIVGYLNQPSAKVQP